MDQNIIKPGKSTLQLALAIAAGFSFYVVCMIFSMVGPAGSRVPYAQAQKNKVTFLCMVFVTIALAGSSAFLGMQSRKMNGTPVPKVMLGLCVLCFLIVVGVLMNGFAI